MSMRSAIFIFLIVSCVLLASTAFATDVDPVFVAAKAIGGSDLNQYTKGVAGGSGPNNIGMLIKTFGKVTYVDTTNKFFYINDGADRMDGTTRTNGGIVYGIRVSYGGLASGITEITPPTENAYVAVTGIISTFMVGNLVQPNVRARQNDDIRYF